MNTWTVAIWTIKAGREDEFATDWQVFFDWTVREVPGVIGRKSRSVASPQGEFSAQQSGAAARRAPHPAY